MRRKIVWKIYLDCWLINEHSIRVEFSISDLNLMNNNAVDDDALYEDESGELSENTQAGGSKSGKDSRSVDQDEDDEFLDEEPIPEPTFPAHLSIVIEKVCYQMIFFKTPILLEHFANGLCSIFKTAKGRIPKNLRPCSGWHDHSSKCCVSSYFRPPEDKICRERLPE